MDGDVDNVKSGLKGLRLTFLNDVPSLTNGTEGKDRLGFIVSDPACKLYRLDMTISRSEEVFTGKKRLRGTFTPEFKITLNNTSEIIISHY